MRFFNPNQRFFDWIKSLVSQQERRLVIDCGCGDGDLVRELRDEKIPAVGLDPRYAIFDERIPVELTSCILPMEAEESTLVTSTPAILLVCRPCHSGFPMLINRSRHSDSLYFYVGLEKNVLFDLGNAPISLVAEGVGRDGENLWAVEKPKSISILERIATDRCRRVAA